MKIKKRKPRRFDQQTEQQTAPTIDFAAIAARLQDCPDIIRKKVYVGDRLKAYFLYIDGLTDIDLLQRDFIRPILAMDIDLFGDETAYYNLPCGTATLLYDTNEIIDSVLSGDTLFICESLPFGVAVVLTDIDKRALEEPIIEKNVRGPHEGFIEHQGTNLAILRRRIKSSQLKFKSLILGRQTKQKVTVAYMDGIADIEIVNRLLTSLGQIEIDGLLAIGYIEQSLTSHRHSLFPQFYATERPDKAMAALLEGRVVIVLDGTPVVLIAPVSFFSFFQALDDYSTLWTHGTFMRLIRFIALVAAIFLPSMYIALTSFHYYAVPLDLLVPLAESRAKVPFPPIIEVLLLEATVEMVREAAIRLPTYIGTAISVVAGLIIGEAAVQAGIVSDLLIVIVAATAIASYVIPSYDMAMAVRILRFIFIIATSIFGIIGIVVCTALTVAHLFTMDSLGQPYFQPLIPTTIRDLKDTIVRLPLQRMKKRPGMTRTKNRRRSR